MISTPEAIAFKQCLGAPTMFIQGIPAACNFSTAHTGGTNEKKQYKKRDLTFHPLEKDRERSRQEENSPPTAQTNRAALDSIMTSINSGNFPAV